MDESLRNNKLLTELLTRSIADAERRAELANYDKDEYTARGEAKAYKKVLAFITQEGHSA